jgi:hypothetical protein
VFFTRILTAAQRAQQMRRPLDTATPVPQTRDALAKLLVQLGVSILKTVCHPEVLTVFRLAIAESDRAPEIARTLDSSGHEANQKALTDLSEKLRRRGWSKPVIQQFWQPVISPRWGDLLIRLLMRLRRRRQHAKSRSVPVLQRRR